MLWAFAGANRLPKSRKTSEVLTEGEGEFRPAHVLANVATDPSGRR